MKEATAAAPREGEPPEQVVARIREALRGLTFGEIRLVIHDGEVVQLERIEKIRLPRR